MQQLLGLTLGLVVMLLFVGRVVYLEQHRLEVQARQEMLDSAYQAVQTYQNEQLSARPAAFRPGDRAAR